MKKAYLAMNQISIYSLAATLALDLFWNLFDVTILLAIFLAPVIFVVCLTLVTLVQHYVAHEDWGEALAKGLILGFIAAIPFSVTSMLAAVFYGFLDLNYRSDLEVILLGRITKSWKQLENILRKPFISTPDYDVEIFKVINFWFDRNLISQVEKNNLHRIRELRNRTVHASNEPKLSTDELSALAQQIENYSTTLAHRLGE
jgi:hypothetical protein